MEKSKIVFFDDLSPLGIKEGLEILLSKELITRREKELFERELKLHVGHGEISLDVTNTDNEFIVVPVDQLEYKGKNRMLDQNLKQKVQSYINCFRNEIGQYLEKTIGQEFNVVSFPTGVIFELKQDIGMSNSDSFKEASTIKEAFNILNRKPEDYLVNEKSIARYNKALDEDNFNVEDIRILVGNSEHSILVISGKEDDFWTPESAKGTVETIVDFMEKMNAKSQPKPNK